MVPPPLRFASLAALCISDEKNLRPCPSLSASPKHTPHFWQVAGSRLQDIPKVATYGASFTSSCLKQSEYQTISTDCLRDTWELQEQTFSSGRRRRPRACPRSPPAAARPWCAPRARCPHRPPAPPRPPAMPAPQLSAPTSQSAAQHVFHYTEASSRHFVLRIINASSQLGLWDEIKSALTCSRTRQGNICQAAHQLHAPTLV